MRALFLRIMKYVFKKRSPWFITILFPPIYVGLDLYNKSMPQESKLSILQSSLLAGAAMLACLLIYDTGKKIIAHFKTK
jgi:hypothetical protein